ALERVAADKRREARDGFDGSWVAHPDLIPTARAEFDAVLADRPNQLERTRDEVHVTARDLLDIRSAGGEVTLAGVRANVSITVRYLESWLRGVGAAAIDNLMEDAATAEISRSQLWQWMHHDHRTVEGEQITRELVEGMLASVLEELPRPEGHRLEEAEEVFRTVTLQEDFPTFLTVPAYARFLVERAEPARAAAAAA
ncbi:MAG: malate synthase A, partial [Microbacteriaceae bacterium]|nr:malate synthase A [Microbacteriaceae bacterium]